MRVPQVSERIKEAPAQALRGVFAGIGQLLLITDKLRNKTPADQDVPRARTPEAPAKATVTSPAGQGGHLRKVRRQCDQSGSARAIVGSECAGPEAGDTLLED